MFEKLGENLEELLKQCGGRFSLQTVTLVFIQALKRLRSFHSVFYIHRDLKPDNFIIGNRNEREENTIYLIDFGFS